MVSVASLLNPAEAETQYLPSPQESRASPEPVRIASPPPCKKPRMAKDAAVFIEGKASGDVRYPPFEKYGEATLQELRRFSVYPIGTIGKYSRRIPYNSDKKTFWEKTGREAFYGLRHSRVPWYEAHSC